MFLWTKNAHNKYSPIAYLMFTLQAYIRVTSDAFIEVVIYCKHILQILYNKCLMFVNFKYNACMNHVKNKYISQ